MFKENIRERIANKLTLSKTILELIKDGKVISPDIAGRGHKDLDEIMVLVDKEVSKTVNSKFSLILWIKKVLGFKM